MRQRKQRGCRHAQREHLLQLHFMVLDDRSSDARDSANISSPRDLLNLHDFSLKGARTRAKVLLRP
jgi:hypothetical protein